MDESAEVEAEAAGAMVEQCWLGGKIVLPTHTPQRSPPPELGLHTIVSFRGDCQTEGDRWE